MDNSKTRILYSMLAVLVAALSCGCESNAKTMIDAVTDHNETVWRSSAQNARLIIFVHGIFGDKSKTWQAAEGATSWPGLLVKDSYFDSFDISSIGFSSPILSRALAPPDLVGKLKETIERRLREKEYSEVFFVAHSMGGLLVLDVTVHG